MECERKEALIEAYLSGDSRAQAREKLRLENSVMSGLSSRNNLYWFLSTDERKRHRDLGIVPIRSTKPKDGRTGRKSPKTRATEPRVMKMIENVVIEPIVPDHSPRSLAPHLYNAPPVTRDRGHNNGFRNRLVNAQLRAQERSPTAQPQRNIERLSSCQQQDVRERSADFLAWKNRQPSAH
jgi:hypothetical protein